MRKELIGFIIAGAAAGVINGLLGTGGGLLLVPILTRCTQLDEKQIFPSSVSIILPICIVALLTNIKQSGFPLQDSWPYLLGSVVGGVLAALIGQRIPVKWLHRTLGILILWGGIRYLC